MRVFTERWYGKTSFCRTSLRSGTATAVLSVPTAPPMVKAHATHREVAYFVYMFVLHSRLLIAEVKVRGNCVPRLLFSVCIVPPPEF